MDATEADILHELEKDLTKSLKYMEQCNSNGTLYGNFDAECTEESLRDARSRVGWGGRVKYAVNEIESIKERQQVEEFFPEAGIFRDPNKMLSITISTIMLIASGRYDIPVEYFLWTELYLLSIKDKNGKTPPNIRTLLEHIKLVKKEKNYTYKLNGGANRFALTPKKSRIPVLTDNKFGSKGSLEKTFAPIASSTMTKNSRPTQYGSQSSIQPSINYIPWQIKSIYNYITTRLIFNLYPFPTSTPHKLVRSRWKPMHISID